MYIDYRQVKFMKGSGEQKQDTPLRGYRMSLPTQALQDKALFFQRSRSGVDMNFGFYERPSAEERSQ